MNTQLMDAESNLQRLLDDADKSDNSMQYFIRINPNVVEEVESTGW